VKVWQPAIEHAAGIVHLAVANEVNAIGGHDTILPSLNLSAEATEALMERILRLQMEARMSCANAHSSKISQPAKTAQ
jgi:hypothetical protein